MLTHPKLVVHRHSTPAVSLRCRILVFTLDALALVVAVALVLLFAGCAQTTYESSIYDKDGKVVGMRKLKTSTLLVNRELGKVVLGDASMEGAKSDQTSAIEALAAIAGKGRAP